jgi:hypothetical protein
MSLTDVDNPDNAWGITRGDDAHLRQLAAVRAEVTMRLGIQHPNVVRAWGAVADGHGDVTMLALELAVGDTLTVFCERAGLGSGEGLALATLLRLFRDAARGLAYLHSLQPPVVHFHLTGDSFFVCPCADDPSNCTLKVRAEGVQLASASGPGPLSMQVGAQNSACAFRSRCDAAADPPQPPTCVALCSLVTGSLTRSVCRTLWALASSLLASAPP